MGQLKDVLGRLSLPAIVVGIYGGLELAKDYYLEGFLATRQ
jgi:hypothetical protein